MKKMILLVFAFLVLTGADARKSQSSITRKRDVKDTVLQALDKLDVATAKMDTSVQHLKEVLTK